MTLYHFTCSHSHQQLLDMGASAVIRPLRELTRTRPIPANGDMAWFTDLAVPIRDALGLTSYWISCDRTEHRWKVTDEAHIYLWSDVRHQFSSLAEELESSHGAQPERWFVAFGPVPVEYAPTPFRMGSHWSQRLA